MAKNKTILWTTNLSMFELVSVNREITDSQSINQIKEISNDMKSNGYRYTEPMVVTKKDRNGKHKVVDGQHRFSAAVAAGVGVYYVVDEDIPLTKKGIFDAFIMYNSVKKKVRKNDYIHGFAEMGNENFKVLQEFGEKYPMFSLTERMMLLQNSGTKHPSTEQFQQGKFNIANLNTAEKWANYLLQIREFFPKGYNKSNFVRAILTIAEKNRDFKFDELINKIKLRPGSIHLCGDKRSYSEMIEDIYNYHRRKNEQLDLRIK
jgi:hypothetical protein